MMNVRELKVCNRKMLRAFLSNQLDQDERLDFLYHLDICQSCWEEVYNATKATHPHYYKTKRGKVKISEKELQKIDREKKEQKIEVA